MPYIDKHKRISVAYPLKYLESLNLTKGDINYVITQLLQIYIHQNGKSYSNLNDVIGILECAKMEFYRRVIVPYEHGKILSNGDVFDDKN